MTKITNKLHPLYGQAIDEVRCSGRTTGIALEAIRKAIMLPSTEHAFVDHVGGTPKALYITVLHLVKRMELRFFFTAIEGSIVYVRCERLDQ